ncbi:MAG: exodeoxyribonuclease V subunit beta [Opitutales bacterium]
MSDDPFEPFDLATSPVEAGITCLEASAGTGKTYTIEGLVLRLVVEKRIPIERILVVTFTEAATAELTGRIRNRLTAARDALRFGKAGKDPALTGLGTAPEPEREAARTRLDTAILDYDRATIATIHGFCQRLLAELAFETGSLFDTELEARDTTLLRELEEDYRRSRFYGRYPRLRELGEEQLAFPQTFTDLLRRVAKHVVPRVGPEPAVRDLSRAETTLQTAVDRVLTAWPDQAETLLAALSEARRFNKSLTDKLETTRQTLDSSARAGAPVAGFWKAVATLANANDHVNKRSGRPTDHPLVALCGEAGDAADTLPDTLLHDYLAFAAEHLASLKARRNIRTFDDLLSDVFAALQSPHRAFLVEEVGGRFDAALIDEFQDTDPRQWAIFHTLFRTAPGGLFLIGDPKQAIYGFRGADVFAYFQAARTADQRYTLDRNYRSDPLLIEAVNRLFSLDPHPFRIAEIPFHPVHPGHPDRTGPTDPRGAPVAPCRFRLLTRDGSDDAADEAEDAAQAIAHYLQADLRIEGRSIRPGDIAVLARSNRQVEAVRTACTALGIPTVSRTEASVFDTTEAEALVNLLEAWINPGNRGQVAAALVGPLYGMPVAAVDDDADPTRLEAAVAGIAERRSHWLADGFMAAFQAFLQETGLPARILARADGERSLTNLLHLAEILHRAETTERLSPGGLVAWLTLRRQDPESRDRQEDPLRLESDAERVQLLTIHRSKGLQFPIVLLPFASAESSARRPTFLEYHDPAGNPHVARLTDTYPPEADRHRAALEAEAEDMRLLYVALTRARHLLRITWRDPATNKDGSRPKNKQPSALEHLLAGEIGLPGAARIRKLCADRPTPFAEETDAAAGPVPTGSEADPDDLRPRPFHGRIARLALLTSFTGLTRQAAGVLAEEPDRDPADPTEAIAPGGPPPAEPAGSDRPDPDKQAFPAGARTGDLVHRLLETASWTDETARNRSADRALEASSPGPGARPEVLHRLLTDALTADLPDPAGGPAFRLADLPPGDRRAEVEFHLATDSPDPARLGRALATGTGAWPAAYPATLENLARPQVSGFLKGYIDLVFRYQEKYYILDWKSNRLEAGPDPYGPTSLRFAMAHHHYFLQYALYTVALHRHLGRRLPDYTPDRHLGGTVYVFLRGTRPGGEGSGFFTDRPDPAWVEALDRALTTEAAI